jgi:1,4-dihydroxy-2-naphthoate octaprenyltransferase
VSWRDVRDCIVHLRLYFQVLLSPIFLLGYVIAGGGIHAGGTAYNSYYDRDDGPIGGLEHPPPVPRGLLPFSLTWQIIGFVMALGVNLPFALIYAMMFALSIAYSHPRTRFKGKPVAALATVALGQGVLGYLGGWVCARGDVVSVFVFDGLLGALAATLITVGFYPLTEIYQIEEDRRRGDRTLALWLGPTGSFRFALACLSAGGLAAFVLVLRRYQAVEAWALAAYLLFMLIAIWRWSRTFQPVQVIRNFRMVMRLYAVTSVGFIGWLGLHLARVL